MRTTDTDYALSPVSGRSRDGRPLAFHRAPAPDLAPWIARLFVTVVDQPADQTIPCSIMNDVPFVRAITRGDWRAETAGGPVECDRGALLFGAHSQAMPISVSGPFTTFGFCLKPGAMAALGEPWGHIELDHISFIDDPTLGKWMDFADVAGDAEGLLDLIEADLRALVAGRKNRPPPELAAAFDRAAFEDPTQPIGEFAEQHGVHVRRVERMAQRAFGLSPKQVMRRARVLDMASQILRLADDKEAEEHALRFYDQSHLIRDFKALLGFTPRQLAQRPHPILALSLETRQARRLEALGRAGGDLSLPWR